MRFYFFILLVLGTVTATWAQSGNNADQALLAKSIIPTPQIAKILISGNRHTKPQIIRREMKTQVGDTVDIAILQADQNRIHNLGLFNRVEIDSLQRPEGVHLLVGVTEYPLFPFYISPFYILRRNNLDWDKLSYGAGIAHLNFRGRNEKAVISAWAGYDPGFAVDYSNPWLFGPMQLLTSFRFAKQRVRDLSFANIDSTVDQKRIGGAWSIGRRFGLFTYLSLSFGYAELIYDPPEPAKTLNPSGRDHLPSVGLAFRYDTRDLFEYPRSGVFLELWGKQTGLNSNHVHFWRYGGDFRGYKKIYRSLSIGARAMANLSQDRIPRYERVFLGYATRVRGYFHHRKDQVTGQEEKKDEGENLALASVELRFPILPWRYFSVSDAPALASYLQNMKFGLSAGIFADYGRVWFQDPPADGSRRVLPPRFGYGAGLHFHLPYINLLRVELAFDEDGRSEWITDIGVAF